MTFGKPQEEKKISPINMYFDWKSDKEAKIGTFKGWNKELEVEVKVIPEEFILLETTSCVKGWDSNNNCGIFSNEIRSVRNEELIIKSFKGWEIYKGLYDKEKVKTLDCKFNKGIIVQEWDLINEYYLAWGALLAFNEQTQWLDYQNYKIKFDWVEEKKKGAVVYYIPKWTLWSKITDKEREVAMNSVELLNEYFN